MTHPDFVQRERERETVVSIENRFLLNLSYLEKAEREKNTCLLNPTPYTIKRPDRKREKLFITKRKKKFKKTKMTSILADNREANNNNALGLKPFFKGKVEALEIAVRDGTQNLRRLEAQRNELNSRGLCSSFHRQRA